MKTRRDAAKREPTTTLLRFNARKLMDTARTLDVLKAQKARYHRARCNQAARRGEYMTGQHTGRTDLLDRPGWRLSRDGCPNGETLDSVGARADRVIGRIRAEGGTVLLFGHREVLRILAVRWIGLAPIQGRHLLLATASLGTITTSPSPSSTSGMAASRRLRVPSD